MMIFRKFLIFRVTHILVNISQGPLRISPKFQVQSSRGKLCILAPTTKMGRILTEKSKLGGSVWPPSPSPLALQDQLGPNRTALGWAALDSTGLGQELLHLFLFRDTIKHAGQVLSPRVLFASKHLASSRVTQGSITATPDGSQSGHNGSCS